MSRKVSGRSSGVVIWHSPCAHPAVPLALEGGWGWAAELGPAASLKFRAHGRCAEGSRAQSFQIVGICQTHCVQSPVVSPWGTQWTKGQVPIPLGFPFYQERENGNCDSSGEARVRRTGAVRWCVWMGSAGKVWVERLTFEQQPEQAGHSGGRAGAERRQIVCESPRQEYSRYVWGAARGPEEPEWIVMLYFVTQNSCMNQLSLKEWQIYCSILQTW